MKISEFVRCTVSVSVTAALLAGCGALRQAQGDMQPPVAAPGMMPQSRTASGSGYEVIHTFKVLGRGSQPKAPLINVDGTLYGTTNEGGEKCRNHAYNGYNYCGTVYAMTVNGAQRVLYRFKGGTDGANPSAPLINVNGALYGTTAVGGDTSCTYTYEHFGCGTVYSVSASGTEKVLHRFEGTPHDGTKPESGLIDVNGTLYGTTWAGGKYIRGTLFSIETNGGEHIVYHFKGVPDARNPMGELIDVNGMLYGTTEYGGQGCSYKGCGTVYRVSTGGSEKVLHRFMNYPDGAYPEAGLIDVDGVLYGTTTAGGAGNQGTVFTITTKGVEKVLYSFNGGGGANPASPLIYLKGKLYGTTTGGGYSCGIRGDCGTVYSLTTQGSEQVLHAFAGGADGCWPQSGLIDLNDMLYGVVPFGGHSGKGCNLKIAEGTVFALTP